MLRLNIGQYSDAGRKTINQDFHASIIPEEPLSSSKGIALAIADGISSSQVSQIASETAVKVFLEDYYTTPDSWSVKTSAQRVLLATNSWLYAQSRNGPYRYDIEKGYVCTFSALVLKSTTAHIFHAGDARVYRSAGNRLEQLTEDHRQWVSREKSYLSRALGMREQLSIDYHSMVIEAGDTFILATDGVYEYIEDSFVINTVKEYSSDLDSAARLIVDEAIRNGSKDNLTIQIAHIDQLPQHSIDELHQQSTALPFPPDLRPRMTFDGYEILREIHNSHRSHIYLALDTETKQQLILKTPSVELRNNADYLERFLMEEWVAHRVDNAHILKPCKQTRKRNHLYTTTEFIDGQTLHQWMIDNPNPSIETVRNIIEQIAKGLQALHRQEILHQDLRPSNIMIDNNGTAKIIDFGSVRVSGLAEVAGIHEQKHILGTAQYAAPEYFVGEVGTNRSDIFSLGVIIYQMLSGQLPYGANIARATSRSAQHKLAYKSMVELKRDLPYWIDGAIRKATHINPYKRYEELSEFIYDLRTPNPLFSRQNQAPILERNPVLFWKSLSLILVLIIVVLCVFHPALN